MIQSRFIHLLIIILISTYSYSGPPKAPIQFNADKKILLQVGWNLIAPPTNAPLHTSLIENVDDNSIWLFSKNKWEKAINKSIPAGQGFWVKVSKIQTLKIQKKLGFSTRSFKISSGWNLLGMSEDAEYVTNILQHHKSVSTWEFYFDGKNTKWREGNTASRWSIRAGQGFWLKKN